MECLLCYKVTSNSLENHQHNLSLLACACKLLELSNNVNYGQILCTSPKICQDCFKKLNHINLILNEEISEENSSILSRIKKEIEDDLLESQKLSEEDGNVCKIRSKIVKEIMTRLKSNDHSTTADSTNTTTTTNLIIETKPDDSSQKTENRGTSRMKRKYPDKNIDKELKEKRGKRMPNLTKIKNEPAEDFVIEINPNIFDDSDSDDISSNSAEPCKNVIKESDNKNNSVPEGRRKRTFKNGDPRAKNKCCEICFKQFPRHSLLVIHHRMHTGETPFLCDQPNCGKGFRSNYLLSTHLKTHGIGKGVLKCTECNLYLISKTKYDLHMKLMHQEAGVNMYKCDFKFCTKSFRQERSLREHRYTKHLGLKYVCREDDCGYTFETTNGLNEHLKRNHLKAFKYYCHSCEKGFLKNSQITQHKSKNHNIEKLILLK